MKFLYKMYKYEMDPTRTVEATERTRDAGRTRDGRTDRRSETNIPPQQLRCAGGYDNPASLRNSTMQASGTVSKRVSSESEV